MSETNSLIVVVDPSAPETPKWVRDLASGLGITLISREQIRDRLRLELDPQILMMPSDDDDGREPSARVLRRIFDESVAAVGPKLLLVGIIWVFALRAKVDWVFFDLDLAVTRPDIPQAIAERGAPRLRAYLFDQVKAVDPRRVRELPPGLSDKEKIRTCIDAIAQTS